MILTLTGGASPLHLLGVEYEGELIIAHAFFCDVPTPLGTTLRTDDGTSVYMPQALPAGLYFEHDDDLAYKLTVPLVFIKGENKEYGKQNTEQTDGLEPT